MKYYIQYTALEDKKESYHLIKGLIQHFNWHITVPSHLWFEKKNQSIDHLYLCGWALKR